MKTGLAMITNGDFYTKDYSFSQLSPVYDVSALDIQEYIKQRLLEKG